MANRAILSMYGRLGFSAAACTKLAVEQGMDDLMELLLLTDPEVDLLMKAVKIPGGANVGELVSMRAIINLKLACFFIRHRERTSRTCTAATVTLPRIRALRALRTTELSHKDPADTSGFSINGNNWPKTVEALSLFLSKHLGVTKVPLGYVIRAPEVVPLVSAASPDPAYGETDLQYATHTAELIARAPFFLNALAAPVIETYNSDNGSV